MQTSLDSRVFFEDREEALKKLIEILPLDELKERKFKPIAVSPGGVYFAKYISKRVGIKPDFIFTEPISAPNNEECVIAMVSETEEIVIHEALRDSFDIKLDFIYGEAGRKYEENILKYIYKYRKGEMISSLKEQNVLLLDEGCETGMTFMTAVKTAIAAGARNVYIATPLIPASVEESLKEVVDEIYSLHKIGAYIETSHYYKELPQLDAEAVEKILKND
ncbi:phosphoribosyltransferase family protein [Nitrosophilus alvini]|uniref:phosphoribosyltransferase family protein n=1 Tax=Nitrosophilus alvini TaxID=2714855 RepID=UPI00190E3CAF|nr:phosphoribosyltransferase family protein [Nitrosophilus alvini]